MQAISSRDSIDASQHENLEAKHQVPVDLSRILKSNAVEFGIVVDDCDDAESDLTELSEESDGNSNSNSAPAAMRPGGLSSKERKTLTRKEKVNKERNKRKQIKRRRMKEARGFEPDISSTATVHEVRGDYSRTVRTRPSFVGNSIKTHKATILPSNISNGTKKEHNNQIAIEDLHPDCDEEVKRLVEDGWTYIPNDLSCAQVIVDEEGRIIATKARQPRNQEQYLQQHVEAFNCMVGVRDSVKQSKKSLDFSRQQDPSKCPSISRGMSFGGGQTIPKPLGGHNNTERTALRKLCKSHSIKKMINLTSVDFRERYPEVATLYEQLQVRLGIVDQERRDIFKDSPFCGTTFNLGPKASTKLHRDCRNLIGGLCAIIILGRFNHETSGHLILEDIRTILEVRAGDVVFIPSAGIAHRNSSLKEDEDRCSIVQYTAGGLFRTLWPDATKNAGVDTDIGNRRWKESLLLLGSIHDSRSRLEREQWTCSFIGQGLSTLLPPP